jgi:2-methylcitrate dehydratase PrpD
MLAAKFSIPHAIAAALVLGDAGVGAFGPAALDDARIRGIARRVEIVADPEMSPRRVDHPTARVRLSLRDGRVLEDTASVVRGDAAAPVSADEVVDKFMALASPVLGEPRARRAAEVTREVDTLKDVRDLTIWLAPESAPVSPVIR